MEDPGTLCIRPLDRLEAGCFDRQPRVSCSTDQAGAMLGVPLGVAGRCSSTSPTNPASAVCNSLFSMPTDPARTTINLTGTGFVLDSAMSVAFEIDLSNSTRPWTNSTIGTAAAPTVISPEYDVLTTTVPARAELGCSVAWDALWDTTDNVWGRLTGGTTLLVSPRHASPTPTTIVPGAHRVIPTGFEVHYFANESVASTCSGEGEYEVSRLLLYFAVRGCDA